MLDPIDGTRGYLSGTPTWGVLISVRDAAGPIYGIIDQPYIGERFEGGLGRARVVGPMGEAALAARAARAAVRGDPVLHLPRGRHRPTKARPSAGWRRKAKLVRYGTDCYAYALIAAGQIDLVIEAGLQAYDVQAPIAVIEAAGGIVTDWQGRPALDGGQHPCRRQPRDPCRGAGAAERLKLALSGARNVRRDRCPAMATRNR